MARKKITQVTDRDIQGIINNSVQSAKNRLVGSATEQKKLFVRPIANVDGSPNVADLVKRLAKETEEAFQAVEENVEDLEDSLVTPPPADSIPLSGVFFTYDRDTETLDIVGEKGVDEEDVGEIVEDATNGKFTALEDGISALSTAKQDRLEIADGYSASNKVATEATVARETAKIIGGAGESFDTLKEIADWISKHPESVAQLNALIANNASRIDVNARNIALNTVKADNNTSAIETQRQRIDSLNSSVNALAGSKQNKLEFAGGYQYDSTTNKVATERSVAEEVAKIVGGAPESLDTLKEIADWINNNPDSVATINAMLAEHAGAIQRNADAIAEKSVEIAANAENIRQNSVSIGKSSNAIQENTRRIGIAEADISALNNSKQNKLEFEDEYNPASNKVATVETVTKKVSAIIAGAPGDFDTLKEIAAWIASHPEDVTHLNALIQENAQAISRNSSLISDNALGVRANSTKIYANEVGLADVKTKQAQTEAAVALKLDKTTAWNKVYGTDEQGNQTTYDVDKIGNWSTVLVGGERVVEFNADSKQDKIEIADGYSESNPVATVNTVSNKIAEIVADAPDDFNTLKEIAEWIAAHPNDISMLNALIQENSRGIALNASLIVNNTKAINDNAKRINNVEIGLNDANEYYSRLSKTVEDKADKDSVSNIIDTTVGKTNMPNQLYGTDADGNPALYPTDSVGTSVFVDGQKVKEFNADEKFNKSGGVIGGDVSIQGNLSVSGTTTTKDTETLQVKDNVIVANADGVSLVDDSGFAIKTNETDAYGIMYDPIGDGVKIGLGGFTEDGKFVYNEGEAQFLATRADNITDGNLPQWDNDKKQFVDSGEKIGDYVKKTDYATEDNAGVVKVSKYRGFAINLNGLAELFPATDADLINRAYYMPITGGNFDKAVKVGITTNTETLTDAEKTSACEWLGAMTKPNFTDAGLMFYSPSTGDVERRVLYQGDPSGSQIPMADKNGCIKTRVPQADLDCANKIYTDNLPDYLTLTDEQKAKWRGMVGAAEVVVVDLPKMLGAYDGVQDVELYLSLSKRAANGEITIVGSLNGQCGVITGIDYVENADGEVSKANWSNVTPIWYDMGEYTLAAVFFVEYRDGVIIFEQKAYPLSNLVSQLQMEEYIRALPDNVTLTDSEKQDWRKMIGATTKLYKHSIPIGNNLNDFEGSGPRIEYRSTSSTPNYSGAPIWQRLLMAIDAGGTISISTDGHSRAQVLRVDDAKIYWISGGGDTRSITLTSLGDDTVTEI